MMTKLNPTISKALVPVSPLRDHLAKDKRTHLNADHAYQRKADSVDRVAISAQATVPKTPPSPKGYDVAPLKDSPQTRQQVRTHYNDQQTAAAANKLTPPGSTLDILV